MPLHMHGTLQLQTTPPKLYSPCGHLAAACNSEVRYILENVFCPVQTELLINRSIDSVIERRQPATTAATRLLLTTGFQMR